MFSLSLYILLPLGIFYFCFQVAGRQRLQKKEFTWKWKIPEFVPVLVLLFLALLLRCLLAILNEGHASDTGCFSSWADAVFEQGFSNFYTRGEFADYPPGYVYILYVLGFLKNTFGILWNAGIGRVLLRFPAMLFDLASAGLIYHMAKKHFSVPGAMLVFGVALFHPAILLNSAVWGQVDSVFTFFVLLMCILITEKKMIPAYYVFGIGLLVKPQMLFFAPVLLIGIIDHVLLANFRWKRFFLHLGSGLGAILLMILLSLPFGVKEVLSQYVDTVASYPYASVNAYNFWTMLGRNWSPESGRFLFFSAKIWGMLFLVLVVGLVFFIRYVLWKKKTEPSCYFLLAALLMSGIFFFSTHMHERYLYPVIGLLLLAYLYEKDVKLLLIWEAYSYVHYMNVAHVLYFFDSGSFSAKAPVPIYLSVWMAGCFVGLLLWIFVWSRKTPQKSGKSEKEVKAFDEEAKVKDAKAASGTQSRRMRIFHLSPVRRAGKKDLLIVAALMLVYGSIAFYDLGDTKAIESFYRVEEPNASIVLQFEQPVMLKKFAAYLGGYEERSFLLETSMDGIHYEAAGEFLLDHVYSWQLVSVEGKPAYYVRLTSKDWKFILGELLLFDEEDQSCIPQNAKAYPELFDEQELWTGEITDQNGTIFDEIYHARTAYEYLNGMYSYENTHPPLGKLLIAAGIKMFGMTPFGWRFMGALFGVLMIPVFYLLARRLLRDRTVFVVLTTILFTFDFMHFTQTRIATIDVFVTFFNLLSFYFMAVYLSMEPYTQKLRKQFLWLGLSGASMGLAIASKWTGIYSACGLAVVFFVSVGFRLREYAGAKKDPEGEFDAISCQTIVKTVPSWLWKTGLFCVGAFLLVPALIYMLSYLPFEDGVTQGLLPKLLRNQQTMWNYHKNLVAQHYYSSAWYQWPVIYKPILYYSKQLGNDMVEGISAMGNPLVWWVGIPAFFYMLVRAFTKKDKNAVFLLIAFLAQFLPWIPVTRLTFIYHYFPSVPFLTLMIGVSMERLEWKNRRLLVPMVIYTVLAVGLFVLFYPVISGHPIDAGYGERVLRWFDSWVLFIK